MEPGLFWAQNAFFFGVHFLVHFGWARVPISEPKTTPKLLQNPVKIESIFGSLFGRVLEGLLFVSGRLPANFQGILGATEARKYGFPSRKMTLFQDALFWLLGTPEGLSGRL